MRFIFLLLRCWTCECKKNNKLALLKNSDVVEEMTLKDIPEFRFDLA